MSGNNNMTTEFSDWDAIIAGLNNMVHAIPTTPTTPTPATPTTPITPVSGRKSPTTINNGPLSAALHRPGTGSAGLDDLDLDAILVNLGHSYPSAAARVVRVTETPVMNESTGDKNDEVFTVGMNSHPHQNLATSTSSGESSPGQNISHTAIGSTASHGQNITDTSIGSDNASKKKQTFTTDQSCQDESQLVSTKGVEINKTRLLQLTSEKLSSGGVKTELISFFNVDRSWRMLAVEEDMTARKVCHRLVLKNLVTEDKNWILIEYQPALQLQRMIEDHEIMFDIYRQWHSTENNKFYFKNDFRKYEMFQKTAQFFPSHMMDSNDESSGLSGKAEKAKEILREKMFSSMGKSHDLQGYLHIREGVGRKISWRHVFCVLRASRICYSTRGNSKDPRFLRTFCILDDVNIYWARTPQETFGSATDFCICLKPAILVGSQTNVHCIGMDDEKTFKCWMVSLRLAKYGPQLKENYDIAVRRQQTLKRLRDEQKNGCADTGGPYYGEDWYHGKIRRADCNETLVQQGLVDGLFLIRQSRSDGCYVLSFVYDKQLLHFKIISKIIEGETRYTIDDGKTNFDTLIGVVDYYRKNRGVLPCKLTETVQK